MIAGPLFLAVALAAPPPPLLCNVDPTLPPLPIFACSSAKEDDVEGGWRCDRSDSIIDDRPYVAFGWVIVAKSKPSGNGLGPADVCSHRDGYTWRCRPIGAGRFDTPCDWHLSARAELR